MIDLSGTALHKRGYRAEAGDAPLRETLAAALALISRPREEVLLWDPFCGSATIPIEAAMIMTRRAPGCSRSFCSEEFPMFPPQLWRDAREEAPTPNAEIPLLRRSARISTPTYSGVAAENARLAGVSDRVKLFRLDAREVTTGGQTRYDRLQSPLRRTYGHSRADTSALPRYRQELERARQMAEVYTYLGRGV